MPVLACISEPHPATLKAWHASCLVPAVAHALLRFSRVPGAKAALHIGAKDALAVISAAEAPFQIGLRWPDSISGRAAAQLNLVKTKGGSPSNSLSSPSKKYLRPSITALVRATVQGPQQDVINYGASSTPSIAHQLLMLCMHYQTRIKCPIRAHAHACIRTGTNG